MKRKIMLGATAGLIGALAIVGAAFAQEGPGDSGPGDSIKDRVAEILGIDRETLDSAMKTARDWNRDANQEERLAVLVEQVLDGEVTLLARIDTHAVDTVATQYEVLHSPG